MKPVVDWEDVASRMAATLTVAEVSATVREASERVFGATAGSVYVADESGGLRLLDGASLPEATRDQASPREHSALVADAVRTGQAIWLDNHDAIVARHPGLAASQVHAMVALPLVSGERPVAGLLLTFATPRRFDVDDKNRLLDFARQCALATERARLYTAEQTARFEAESLLRIADSINGAQLDLAVVVQKVTDESTSLVDAKFGAFFYVSDANGESCQLFALSGAPRSAFEKFELPRNTPIFAPTFNGEAVVRIANVKKDPRYGTMGPHYGMPEGHLPVTSYLAAPVVSSSGTVIGGLFFGHPDEGRFTEQHERLVTGLASIAAVAIENALMFRTTRDAEERQRRLADEMAETVRLNELFTGVLAHDLRNPLAGIVTAARLASTRTQDEKVTKPLARVLASSERMARMVEQLLDVGRVRLGQTMPIAPAPADLSPIVHHVVDELRDAHRDTTVTVEQTGDTAGVWDVDRMAQVFSNLLGNALQHGAGKQVRIWLDGSGADQVVFRIQNEGAIPPALVPTLFDPFSAVRRPHEKARGLGLGLFIAQEIASAHGGRLQVDSSEERGTTFTVTLPRSAQIAAADATKRHTLVEARERVWQSEQRMRLLVDSIRDYGIFMLDIQGRVITWNTGAQRIKGYTAQEIIGQHLSVFYTPPDREDGRPAKLLALAATNGSVEDIGWRVRKDGTMFWADVIITALKDSRGKLSGFVKVTRDLSERREQEERLRRSEEQFRLMVESVRDYAIFKLDPNGIVDTWNAGAERIKGYRASEIIGQHFSVFYEPEDVLAGKCEHELETAAREGRFEDEGWRLRKDGTRFWANVILTVLRDAKGQLIGFTKVTRDLSDRRRLEDERVRRAQAEEATRMRDEFLSMVSHELKTPLTGLQLQLQSLSRRMEASDQRTALQLKRAAASGERLGALIELLLDVSQIADGRLQISPEPLDLTGLIEEVVERFREPARKANSELSVRSKGELGGQWDRLRLEQMIASLLSNALKYGAGTDIEVCLSSIDQDDQVLIEVRDHGPGIAEHELQGLFERFARRGSMRHFGGLGLGLYLVREIARAHGGQVEVHNARDGGAYFAVRLPRDATLARLERTDAGGSKELQ